MATEIEARFLEIDVPGLVRRLRETNSPEPPRVHALMTTNGPPDSLRIRPFEVSDASALARMFDEFQAYLATLDPMGLLARSLPAAYGQAYLEKTLAEVEQQGGLFLLAEEGGQVVGFGVGVLEPTSEIQVMESSVRRPGRLTELYVDPARRSQGIGARLLREMETWFRAQGCDSVRIEVFAPNQRARAFYRREGYEDWLVDTRKIL
jgi:ribosomal protein S18 acetylase RimI-like enzyme